MLPSNIPPCAPLLGFGGFGNLVLFGSARIIFHKNKCEVGWLVGRMAFVERGYC